MIASLDTPAPSGRARRLVEVATVIGWILFAAAIGYSYLGHSSSPYGVCYTPSGRSVSCAALSRH
jgi:hypothetical protein